MRTRLKSLYEFFKSTTITVSILFFKKRFKIALLNLKLTFLKELLKLINSNITLSNCISRKALYLGASKIVLIIEMTAFCTHVTSLYITGN